MANEKNLGRRDSARSHLNIIGESLVQAINIVDELAEEKNRFTLDHRCTSLLLAEALLKVERAKIHMRKRKRLVVPTVKPV